LDGFASPSLTFLSGRIRYFLGVPHIIEPHLPIKTSYSFMPSVLAAIALILGLASAQTVTNFSNFSESGNLLTSPNIRNQTFTPSGTSITVTTATRHANGVVGQETYLSNEFPILTTGDRITVTLTSATFNNNADTVGLAVASTEIPTSRTNILVWGWRSGSMYLTNFDASSANTTATTAYPASGRPDAVFIERTATGWTLGSIKGSTVTIHYTNITTVAGTPTTTITANRSAIGLYSDMRTDTSTWTVSNLTRSSTEPPPPPPPPRDYLPLVSFLPVSDGNEATDENGYAGSATNSIAFIQDNLITVGGQQFIAYYGQHATNSSHPNNRSVIIARRNVNESLWQVFPTSFVISTAEINNTHCVISFAIDGNGFLHISWGMHATVHGLIPPRYAKSTTSVLGTAPISMVAGQMTGQENVVTYPKYLTLPDGDLLFLFREGGSGSGDWYLNRYDTATSTWSPVHANSNRIHQPFMKGTGDSPSNCFYPDRMTLGPNGMLHLAGPFRNSAASFQTNHRYVYLRSPDQGVTWQRSNGTAINLPAVERVGFAGLPAAHLPEIVKDLPQNHSIMNESGMTTDSLGRPIIANWWADNAASGDNTRQYHIFFHNGTNWQQRTVSARNIDKPTDQYGGTGPGLSVSFMGRPIVITDSADRIIVLYNDNRFPGITAVFSEPLAQDPNRIKWTRMNLTHENLGFWEGTYDEPRWKQDGVLHMLYQKLPGMGASYSSQNNATPVSVLEWDAYAYFNNPGQLTLDTTTTPGQATVWAPAHAGFRYDLRTSTHLNFSAPPVGTRNGDGTLQNFGTWPTTEQSRFWRIERTEEASNDL